MSSRKRSRCSSINSINQFSGDRLVIKLGAAENDSNPQLAADILTLRSCCSCCEGLPADAAVWDISSVLVGGTPVKRQTVVEWLNAVYSRLDDSCYEEQKESEVQTMAALFELLTFADAVGSRRGILLHCIGKLSRLMASAKLAQPPVGEEGAVHLVYLPTGKQLCVLTLCGAVFSAQCAVPGNCIVTVQSSQLRVLGHNVILYLVGCVVLCLQLLCKELCWQATCRTQPHLCSILSASQLAAIWLSPCSVNVPAKQASDSSDCSHSPITVSVQPRTFGASCTRPSSVLRTAHQHSSVVSIPD